MGRNVATDTSGKEVSAQEIAQMEQRLQQLNEQCAQLRTTKQSLEDELLELTKASREGTTNLQKWKMEIKVQLKKNLSLNGFLVDFDIIWLIGAGRAAKSIEAADHGARGQGGRINGRQEASKSDGSGCGREAEGL